MVLARIIEQVKEQRIGFLIPNPNPNPKAGFARNPNEVKRSTRRMVEGQKATRHGAEAELGIADDSVSRKT